MPVQIFTSSPIHASEPDGPTPNTARPEPEGNPHDAPAAAQPATTSTTTTSTLNPPSAQPGARPSLPVQTTAPQPPRRSNYLPTQTQPDPATNSNIPSISSSPPAPQPGAAPVPRQQHHAHPPPPPPKTGTAPSSSSSYSYAASSAYTPRARYQRAQYVDNDSEARNYAHPPGYQQNVHAAEFSSAQLAAHNSVFHAGGGGYGAGAGDEDGVWGTAKRWAAAAGESIMAAEEQIWRKINGD